MDPAHHQNVLFNKLAYVHHICSPTPQRYLRTQCPTNKNWLMKKKRPKKYRKNMSFSTTPDVSTLGMPAKKHHTLRQTNIAMGNPPFEDVSPIKKKVNFYCYVSLPEGIAKWGQNLLPMGFCKRRRARLMDKKQVAPRKKKHGRILEPWVILDVFHDRTKIFHGLFI